MINNFKQKKVKCFFCFTEENKKDIWKFEVNTAEGLIVKDMCKSCAFILEEIRLGKSLKEVIKDG